MKARTIKKRLNQKENKKQSKLENEEVSLLIIAKKVGLSLEELNMLTLQELIDFADMFTGNTEEDEEKEVTQEDIDNFYSM